MKIENLEKWITAVAESEKTTGQERSRLEDIQFHYSGYAETGYTDPESGIIATGNWNNLHADYVDGKWTVTEGRGTIPRVADILEHLGVELEWSDEWTACGECGKLVRTQANSYSWTPSYVVLNDCELVCKECAKANHIEAILAEYEGNSNKALSPDLDINLEDHGYVLVLDDLQNGMHRGMDADPKVIEKDLQELGVERFIFALTEASQFYATFALYVHKDDVDKIGDPDDIQVDGPSVSAGLERALKAASKIKHKDGKILVVSCDVSTGRARGKNITHKQFVNGKT